MNTSKSLHLNLKITIVKLVDLKYKYNKVLEELKEKIKKDITRKVCKNCHRVGHISTSLNCPIRINKDKKLTQEILNLWLSKPLCKDSSNHDFFKELSIKLNESEHQINKLFSKIPCKELFHNTNLDLDSFIEFKTCEECFKKELPENIKKWKGTDICCSCWCKDNKKQARQNVWEKCNEYKPKKCVICNDYSESTQYDHINMFSKGDSICNLVKNGYTFQEIKEELDKCQSLCEGCHGIVTNIEKKMPFMREKTRLTKALNQNKITTEQHSIEMEEWAERYENMMDGVYLQLRRYRNV